MNICPGCDRRYRENYQDASTVSLWEVIAEHWLFPLLKLEQYRTEKRGRAFNWIALAVWAGTLVICFLLPIHLFFRWLPGYFIALVSYTFLSALRKK